MFPLQADIYYPIVEQGGYGNLSKRWVLGKTIACALNPAGTKFKQEVQPSVNVVIDNSLFGRTKTNILQLDSGEGISSTNILITNIRDANGNIIWDESSGPRAGKPTLYEVATFTAIAGPFGGVEYYKLVVRRSENQAVDL
jgi:hypothetical protein